ncbi:MAG: YhjD/YihY/BrkB family envelope integrity protein [Candidatus Eisenbacteria bacterium]
MRTTVRQIRRYLDLQIWEQDLSTRPAVEAFLLRELRVAIIVIRGIARGGISLRASAMTYTTLLALVPLLIVGFSIFHNFGGLADLESRLERLVYENIMPGQQAQVQGWLDGIFASLRSGAFSGLTVLFLTGGVLGLLSSIEGAFNDIWGVRKGRSLFHRISTYSTLIMISPILIGLSLSMTASLESSQVIHRIGDSIPGGEGLVELLFRVLPVLLTGIAFTLLYMVMPNVKVRLRAAFPSGMTAAILWEISKMGYAAYLKSATMYTTIYGSLAAIPLFLLWVHVTWIVTLFGAQLTFAQDAADDFREEEMAGLVSQRERIRVGLQLAIEACRSYLREVPAPELIDISQRMRLPPRLVRNVAATLTEGGILHVVLAEGATGIAPARAPERISVYEIIACILTAGHAPHGTAREGLARVDELMARLDQDLRANWASVTMEDCLARGIQPAEVITPEIVPGPFDRSSSGR